MRTQHKDLQRDFVQHASSGLLASSPKVTKVRAGSLVLICPPDQFDALGHLMLGGEGKWVSAVRKEHGVEEFYPYVPHTPFSKYQSMKKQGNQSVKAMTLEKNKTRVTLVNGLLPPGINELDNSKYIWDDESAALYVLWTPNKAASALASKMKSFVGGSSGSKAQSANDPFAQDENFKWIHRYLMLDSCECRPAVCKDDSCQCKSTAGRLDGHAKAIQDSIKPDKFHSLAKPCPCMRCVERDSFTVRIAGMKPEDVHRLIERIAIETVMLQQLSKLHADMQDHYRQVNSTGSRLKSKWNNLKTSVQEGTSGGDSSQQDGDFMPKVSNPFSKTNMLKSMFTSGLT